MLSDNHGAERNVSKFVIVLTDGRSLEHDMTLKAARDLKVYPFVSPSCF